MALAKLDHVNIRTANLAAMSAFYREVLGLAAGQRPAFGFPGAWLYCGATAVVHLVEVADQPDPQGALRLEHFAFAGAGLGDFLALLRRRGEGYEIGVVPGLGIVQVNIHDPDGNHIHIDFDPAEAASVTDEPALAAV